jgi:galactose mutarotase-like enzyme
MTSISKKKFGQFKGSEVTLTTLSGDNTSISIMNWGATIQNWTVNHHLM